MLRFYLIISLVMIPLSSFAAHSDQQQVQQIEKDYQQEKINATERATLSGYRLFAPERLPARYQSDTEIPLKCGTEIILDLRKQWSNLDGNDRIFFETQLQRPSLAESYTSPEELFKLHYDIIGFNAVPSEDTNSNGIPDYIEESAKIFDYCYHYETDTLHYQVPPEDFEVDGPQIDVYFKNIGAYGYTTYDMEIPSTSNNDYSSFITMDNDYAGSGYNTNGLDGVRVTAAHELFHVIQFGYHYRDSDVYFWEMSATWMEDRVFTNINDYYNYIYYYFTSIDEPLTIQNGSHEYGAAIFLKFIQEKYSDDIIHDTWDKIYSYHSLKSLDVTLKEQGSSLSDAFITFGLWNYFTSDRSDSVQFYKEGAHYKAQVFMHANAAFRTDTTITGDLYPMGIHYYQLQPQESSYYRAIINSTENIWRSGAIIDKIGGYGINIAPANYDLDLSFINGGRDIILIIANTKILNELKSNIFDYSQDSYTFTLESHEITSLKKVFPNPFILSEHRSLTFRIDIPQATALDCTIFTSSGRKVHQFSLGNVEKGMNEITIDWDGTDDQSNTLPSGVYLCSFDGTGVHVMVKFVQVD